MMPVPVLSFANSGTPREWQHSPPPSRDMQESKGNEYAGSHVGAPQAATVVGRGFFLRGRALDGDMDRGRAELGYRDFG